jgi:dephospho-CoA kinase
MFRGKPIIGIVGGIGSGKSYVARLFGEEGCLVIDADALVREAYEDPAVRQRLRSWWGGDVFRADGTIDRRAIAGRVFVDDAERRRLEGLLHPWVNERRRQIMEAADAQTVAFVWDTPLLMETGLNRECDAVVFVDAPESERLRRVAAQRGWDEQELRRREKLQMPLDKKRELSDDVLVNPAHGATMTGSSVVTPVDGDARSQVREILSRIVIGLPKRSPQG